MPETKTKSDDKPASNPNDPKSAGDKSHPGNKQEKMGKRLDEALEETFPSSDPVSVKITK